jgi:diguanylate cyclase (GGDEF)-like protein
VDVFDALTSNRPYRRALTHEEAIQTLKEGAGKQFDPKLVAIFERILPEALVEVEQMESEEERRMAQHAEQHDSPSALTRISQAAAEMAAACELAHALADHETMEGIIGVVVSRILRLVPADTAVLYLKEPGTEELRAVAVEGKYAGKLEGMTIRLGEGVAGCVAQNQQPLVNVSAALDVARRFSPEESIELSAATAVPISHGPEVIGTLAVYTQAYSVLTEHHLHVLNVIAEHTAAAALNIRRVERQQELAYTDPLTGLANSRCLVRHLERLSHFDRNQKPFGLIMLDLDRFKEVNDTMGHLRGDELLRQVAETLMKIARAEDVVCRYAGDEFVLLLPGAMTDHATQVARRVRQAIDAIPAVDGRVKIGASVGVASFPQDGADGCTLLNRADQRMYEDKFRRRRERAEEQDKDTDKDARDFGLVAVRR